MNAIRRLMTLLPLAGLLPVLSAAVVSPAVLPLWPEGVPAAVRPCAPAARGDLCPERVDANGAISRVSVPPLTIVPPAVDRPNGTAVILCPGGGHHYLWWQRREPAVRRVAEHAEHHHLPLEKPPGELLDAARHGYTTPSSFPAPLARGGLRRTSRGSSRAALLAMAYQVVLL
jgi:hypothetical protein